MSDEVKKFREELQKAKDERYRIDTTIGFLQDRLAHALLKHQLLGWQAKRLYPPGTPSEVLTQCKTLSEIEEYADWYMRENFSLPGWIRRTELEWFVRDDDTPTLIIEPYFDGSQVSINEEIMVIDYLRQVGLKGISDE